jgi:16S rRNA (guanine527-N7)-methyltransferase
MTIDAVLHSLALPPSLAAELEPFVDLFLKWNRSINLSAASTRDEVVEHLVDSLHVVPHLASCTRVLDVGSGGGFPVVIAALALPTVDFTALEPVHKKHAFLRTAARELGLGNLDARAERLEDHAQRDYDAAMSRATFDLHEWLTRARDYVRTDGRVLGFEAVQRDDLGPVVRHPYTVSGKRRAIVVASRSPG